MKKGREGREETRRMGSDREINGREEEEWGKKGREERKEWKG